MASAEAAARCRTTTVALVGVRLKNACLPTRQRIHPVNLIASDTGRFVDPARTADGQPRARVDLRALTTLWFNTGTLCNVTCAHCYIESSPRNDRLVYLSRSEVADYLAEIRALSLPVREIGFTGGEPFMNPAFPGMLEDALAAGFDVLVLTNAMKPMMKVADTLDALRARLGQRLTIRVSLDHFDPARHEEERGRRTWAPAIAGMRWLVERGFRVHVAARTRWGEDEAELRRGFAALFRELFRDLERSIDADDPAALVLFPEMDATAEVPEITTACWGILGKDPGEVMCASSRMVVKRKGDPAPCVVACTLLPYDERFTTGAGLADGLGAVPLNHPHCARFCVLGGGSCS